MKVKSSIQRLGDCSISWLYQKHGRHMGNVTCEHCHTVIPPNENYLLHFFCLEVSEKDILVCKTKKEENVFGDYKYDYFTYVTFCEDREEDHEFVHSFNKQCLFCGKKVQFGDNHFDVSDNFQTFTCRLRSTK